MATTVALYARRSTDPTHEGLTIERQLADLRAFAAIRGWEVLEELEDPGLDVPSPDGRRVFEHACGLLRDGVVRGVVAWRLDLLVGDVGELQRILAQSVRSGGFVATVDDLVDTSHDAGRAIARAVAGLPTIERHVAAPVLAEAPQGPAEAEPGPIAEHEAEEPGPSREIEAAEIEAAEIETLLAGETLLPSEAQPPSETQLAIETQPAAIEPEEIEPAPEVIEEAAVPAPGPGEPFEPEPAAELALEPAAELESWPATELEPWPAAAFEPDSGLAIAVTAQGAPVEAPGAGEAPAQPEEARLPRLRGPRPYGLTSDWSSVVLEEAEVIRDCQRRILAGASLRMLARRLNRRGIRTSTGGLWRAGQLGRTISADHVAGMRVVRGLAVEDGVLPVIVSRGELERVRETLADRGWGPRGARRHLLAGLVRCGRCGETMYGRPRRGRARRYSCGRPPQHRGCGAVRIAATPTERFVEAGVLHALTLPGIVAGLTGAAVDRGQALPGLAALAVSPVETWRILTLDERRAVLRLLVERVSIGRGRRGGAFDPSRIEIDWRI